VKGRALVVWNVAKDRQLRRVQISFIGFAFAEHATWLAIIFYAYERGGVAEAGLLAMIQLLPAMLVAPFAAYAGDRFRAERVLSSGYAAQSLAMTATALAMWANQPVLAYTAATVTASCITFSRPIVSAVLPAITQTPGDLVAANVVTGFVEYVGMMLGPLIGGFVLAAWSPAAVFAICGAATANSTLTSLRLHLEHQSVPLGGVRARDVLRAVWDGLVALRSHNALRSLIILMSIGGLVRGVTDVLMVLFAEERLSRGGGDAGILGTGLGIGAVVGAVAAAGLIGRARIAPYLTTSALVVAIAFVALSGISTLVLAGLMFALFGLSESLLRVTTAVGVQRLSPDDFLARIFGVGEGLQMASMAFGSLLVALIVRAMGLGPALVVLGVAVIASMAWTTDRFRRRGGDVPPPPDDVIDRMLEDPVFRYLAAPALARLASNASTVLHHAGDAVITEGEAGDRYFLMVEGEVEVTVGGRVTRRMGPGTSFGEIALLRGVPRTATVTCLTDVAAYAIDRDDFLQAVTGHPRSLASASDVADTLISDDRAAATE
jgi:MFS family permease